MQVKTKQIKPIIIAAMAQPGNPLSLRQEINESVREVELKTAWRNNSPDCLFLLDPRSKSEEVIPQASTSLSILSYIPQHESPDPSQQEQ